MQACWWSIVVLGAFGAGKTTFINSIRDDLPTGGSPPPIFGRIKVDETLGLILYPTGGRRRFDYMQDILRTSLGVVMLVDSSDPSQFRVARALFELVQRFSPVPYIIAANKQDQPAAWDVSALGAVLRAGETPVVPCVATQRESVKAVLLALLHHVLRQIEAAEQDDTFDATIGGID